MGVYTEHDDATPYDKETDPEVLDAEIRAGSFTAKVDGLITHGRGLQGISVRTTSDLTGAEKTELDDIIDAHTP